MPQAASQSSRGESSVPASPTISHHWSEQSNLAFPSSDLLTDSPRQSITGQTFDQPAAPPTVLQTSSPFVKTSVHSAQHV